MLQGDEIEALLPDLEKRLLTPWPYLEESRPAWVDSRLLSVGSPALLQAGPPEREQGREYLVAVCEEFALTHELSHHLLGHISSRPARSRARATVASVIDNAELSGKFIGKNQSQRQELEADILAFMLMARAIESTPTFSNIYRALMGSIIALVALAHIKESWVEPDKEASHPDFLARSEVITGLTEWLSRGRPRGDQGDHPLGLLVQLHTFSGLAVKSWLHQQAPEKENQAGMVALMNHVLKLAVDADAKIPNDSRFGYTA